MKILLIQPPYVIRRIGDRRCQPPLGLAYLAGFLKNKHDITVIDCVAEGYNHIEPVGGKYIRYGLAYSDIRKIIERVRPDVAGISCLFSTQAYEARNICSLIKEVDRNIVTVFGGAHPSSLPEEELKSRNLDFVLIGEGELSFGMLLDTLVKNKDFSKIDGIGYKDNGNILVNPKKNFINNLDDLPFPDWAALPLRKYSLINRPHGAMTKHSPFAPVLTSRGCPNNCNFCSIHNVWGRVFRKRSAENVLSEIEYLVDNFGIKEVHFEDDNLTLDRSRALEIFRGLSAKNFGLTWSTPNGVFADTIDETILNEMKRSGCYSVSFGIESGDKTVLEKIINKKINLANIPSIIRYAKRLGLEVNTFFVVGFPQETIKQIRNTFKFARSLGADNVNIFFATPLPGTQLWKEVRENNLLARDYSLRDLVSNFPVIRPYAINLRFLFLEVLKERFILQILLLVRSPGAFLKKLYNKIRPKNNSYD